MRYPNATRLTITADCGGSNGPQLRLWKRELQCFANQTGLTITVTHLPPGTSKWNRIEAGPYSNLTRHLLHRRTLRRQQSRHHSVLVRLSLLSHFLIGLYPGDNFSDTGASGEPLPIQTRHVVAPRRCHCARLKVTLSYPVSADESALRASHMRRCDG